jgi:hypothetical protein
VKSRILLIYALVLLAGCGLPGGLIAGASDIIVTGNAANSNPGSAGGADYLASSDNVTDDFPAELASSELVSTPPTKVVSWQTLGVIIGATIITTIILIVLIISHSRDMLKGYIKDK